MRKLELVSVAMLVWLLPFAAVNKVEGRSQAKPGCKDKCGNVTINYPFGYGTNDQGENCFLTPAFEVNCTNDVPALLNADRKKMFNISEIKFPNQVVLESNQIMAVECTYTTTNFTHNVSFDLDETFKVSAQANRFRAMGCDTTAYINNTVGSFTSRCDTQWMISSGGKKHGGLGQCQIAVPEGSSGYNYSVTDQFDYNKSACWRNCSFAVLAEENFEFRPVVFDSYLAEQEQVNTSISYPLVVEWAINVSNSSCNSSKGNSSICGDNAWCNNAVSASGYHCYCNQDCEGNPYLNGTDGCRTGESTFPTIPVAIAGGALLAATLGASSYSYGSWAQKKAIMKLTSKLLQELHDNGDLSSPDSPVEPDLDVGDVPDDDTNPGDITNPNDPSTAGNNPRDFNQQDLKKAIKIYQKGRRFAIWASRRRVARVDLPGQGPVDMRKYTVQERSQLQLFVKGVRTLSRTVIHANVATLLGISTRERFLIYKQFSERSLRDRLHNRNSDRPSWEERLKIALGTARGLAFAHSKGLYHGNVKSSNILLDEKCNCKLVEFGVARVWSKNTLLNSSRGYVDQEYIKLGTKQLIASMDVYSFGVVLVELITGHDPSSKAFNRSGSSLAMVFISAVDEGRLQEVVDHNIWAEERNEQLRGAADLAKECLQQGGKGRPKMLRVRNIISKWVPKGPGPQAQDGRPKNAAGSRPGVARDSNLQGQSENAQSLAQSALDIASQNVTGDNGDNA